MKVRVLVDDIDARAKHDLFQVADLHPNIEVRIFNPFYSRSGLVRAAHRMADPRPPPQPAHAQQGVDRRQPGRDRGRTQHRRRVLRRLGRVELRRSRPGARRTHRRSRSARRSTSTGTIRTPCPSTASNASRRRPKRFRSSSRMPASIVARRATARTSPPCRTCRNAPTCSRRSRRRSRYARSNCWSTIPRRSASS